MDTLKVLARKWLTEARALGREGQFMARDAFERCAFDVYDVISAARAAPPVCTCRHDAGCSSNCARHSQAAPRHSPEAIAQQRDECARIKAFLRAKGTATHNLRDATTYAEAAALIDAYLEALEAVHG
jgi:hypothetical protein